MARNGPINKNADVKAADQTGFFAAIKTRTNPITAKEKPYKRLGSMATLRSENPLDNQVSGAVTPTLLTWTCGEYGIGFVFASGIIISP